MKKIRAVVVGYGNIGHYIIQTLEIAEDFETVGIVHRQSAENKPAELAAYEVVKDIKELTDVDVVILAVPTHNCREHTQQISPPGVNTVDSFDIHTDIANYRAAPILLCKQCHVVSVISAGQDPGSDSIVCTLARNLVPKSLSYTNFGPGMSMGHNMCTRSKKGVKNVPSMIIPLGGGIHRRMVCIESKNGATLDGVTKEIKTDPYFVHDETYVMAAESVDVVRDMGHGIYLVRKGVSGNTQNQRMEFSMSINNPTLTTQISVNTARASMHQQPGCYTIAKLLVVDMLPGEREDLTKHLI